MLVLIMGGLLAAAQSNGGSQAGLARLLEPVDDFRVNVWRESLSLVQNMPRPLIDSCNRPDGFAALRPLVGYGLDNLDTLRSRTDISVIAATTVVDRMHSLLYDTLLSMGWLGLIAQCLIFEAVWLSLLASVRLLTSRRDALICVGLQAATFAGILFLGLAMGWTSGVRLVFAMVGLVMGLLLWLAYSTTRATPEPVSLWHMGLWSASIFYFHSPGLKPSPLGE